MSDETPGACSSNALSRTSAVIDHARGNIDLARPILDDREAVIV